MGRYMENGFDPDLMLKVIPWTIERLVRGEYRLILDNSGIPQSMECDPDYGKRSVSLIEEDLKAVLPAERTEKLFALREHRTPQEVSEALAVALPPHVKIPEPLPRST